MGIEPATLRLLDNCSTSWAKRAQPPLRWFITSGSARIRPFCFLYIPLPSPNTFSLWSNPLSHQCSVYQDVMIYTTWCSDAMQSLQEPQNHRSQWWFYFFLKQWTYVTFRNQLQSTSKRTNNLFSTMQIQSLSLCCLSVQPPPAGFPYLHSFSLTFFTSLYLLPLLSQISITIFTFSNPFLSFLVYSFLDTLQN